MTKGVKGTVGEQGSLTPHEILTQTCKMQKQSKEIIFLSFFIRFVQSFFIPFPTPDSYTTGKKLLLPYCHHRRRGRWNSEATLLDSAPSFQTWRKAAEWKLKVKWKKYQGTLLSLADIHSLFPFLFFGASCVHILYSSFRTKIWPLKFQGPFWHKRYRLSDIILVSCRRHVFATNRFDGAII